MIVARLLVGTRGTFYAELRAGSDPSVFAPATTAHILTAAPWLGGTLTGEQIPLSACRFQVPVEPSKILGVGRNYRAHAAELGNEVPKEPLWFYKPPSSLLAHEGTVALPKLSERVDYEAEIGVIIGKKVRNIGVSEALSAAFGYTLVCDITARDLQKKDGQWARAKGFDGFCPTGPVIVTGLDPNLLDISLQVNGVARQSGNTSDMVFDVATLIARASEFCTLEPGDLIATGTPAGVGPLSAGDSVIVAAPSIGELAFAVVGWEH
ncbi:MAG: fumarylacetoacetate hydrolase family protein [Polyangiaceae bacterium]|nr:fumarylacetoacetate hydrolase family protein [Polyangiaceae bacterium]